MSFFYIADLHIGHANVIKFDNRPFADLNEMHNTIVDNWNRVVRGDDTVYILGDFCWAKESEWPFYLGPLAGQKVLIRGKYDITKHPNYKLTADFDERNTFDVQEYLQHRLKLKGDEVCSVYEADLPETTEAPGEAIPQN